jgi:hypothetical protein
VGAASAEVDAVEDDAAAADVAGSLEAAATVAAAADGAGSGGVWMAANDFFRANMANIPVGKMDG